MTTYLHFRKFLIHLTGHVKQHPYANYAIHMCTGIKQRYSYPIFVFHKTPLSGNYTFATSSSKCIFSPYTQVRCSHFHTNVLNSDNNVGRHDFPTKFVLIASDFSVLLKIKGYNSGER